MVDQLNQHHKSLYRAEQRLSQSSLHYLRQSAASLELLHEYNAIRDVANEAINVLASAYGVGLKEMHCRIGSPADA
jgi:viroplasmin and RNaseH domain-containing protein